MTNEELKKKIVEFVLNSEITGIQIRAITGGYSMANNIADALIAAGVGDVKEEKFEADHYWNMWQGALVELERAERRAEVAERALKIAEDLGELCAPVEDYINQAEKELAEEGKDGEKI